MIPAWPETLPCQPEVGTWQETPQPNKVAFQPEVGPPIVRRRGTARSLMAQANFIFTKAQYGDFVAFYYDTLKDGALRFSYTHPVRGIAMDWTFEGEPQMSALSNRTVRVAVQLRGLS